MIIIGFPQDEERALFHIEMKRLECVLSRASGFSDIRQVVYTGPSDKRPLFDIRDEEFIVLLGHGSPSAKIFASYTPKALLEHLEGMGLNARLSGLKFCFFSCHLGEKTGASDGTYAEDFYQCFLASQRSLIHDLEPMKPIPPEVLAPKGELSFSKSGSPFTAVKVGGISRASLIKPAMDLEMAPKDKGWQVIKPTGSVDSCSTETLMLQLYRSSPFYKAQFQIFRGGGINATSIFYAAKKKALVAATDTAHMLCTFKMEESL